MGVNGVGGVNGIAGVYTKKGNLKVDKASQVEAKKDVAAISKTGMDFSVAMKAVRETPDIREAKVAELRDKVQNGEYNVSGEDIAEKIIGKLFNAKA